MIAFRYCLIMPGSDVFNDLKDINTASLIHKSSLKSYINLHKLLCHLILSFDTTFLSGFLKFGLQIVEEDFQY